MSPILFCIVMGKLSSDIDSLKDDLVVSGINVGLATHADDIRTCNIGKVSIQDKAVCINDFTSTNSLALNNSKTEIVHLSCHPLPPESISILDNPVVTKKEAKCLGVWWCQDLSFRRSIEENTLKSRRAFFALGAIDVFNGSCNPLSALSLFNTFALPILLYGCEAWFLSDPLMRMLDKFQAEIEKRILRLPQYHTNISVLLGLKWPSFRLLVLVRKLSYLGGISKLFFPL